MDEDDSDDEEDSDDSLVDEKEETPNKVYISLSLSSSFFNLVNNFCFCKILFLTPHHTFVV